MNATIATAPNTLVLGAGGTLGEAWMRGLLSGLREAGGPDMRGCAHFVGTSAGSIVSAVLAAGHAPEAGDAAAGSWGEEAEEPAPADSPPGWLTAAGRAALRLGAPAVPLMLSAAAPGGAVLRAAALAPMPRPGRDLGRLHRFIERVRPRFDGRLLIAAVDRRSGRRVIFGAPGAPRSGVADAVLASCAVPWLFDPMTIGGREYVDGGVWSPTNIDAAPVGRGQTVLCLNPTASLDAARSPFGALRAVSRGASLAESLALRARGADVRVIGPDRASGRAMGANLMDRSRVPEVLAAAVSQGRWLAAGNAH